MSPTFTKTIKVYLLFSSSNTWGGGANIGKNSIILEISRLPFKKETMPFVLGAIWHELTHAYFEKYHFIPLLHKCSLNNQNIDAISEITIRAIVYPEGVLGIKLLKIPILKKKNKTFLLLKKIIKKYIQQKKSLDNEYIKKIIFLLPKLKTMIK